MLTPKKSRTKRPKKATPVNQVKVSSLKRSVGRSYLGNGRVRAFTYVGRLKKFFREYSFPAFATLCFIVLVLVLSVMRLVERTSLISLRNNTTEGANGYSLLLDIDEIGRFIREGTNEQQPETSPSEDVPGANSTQSTSNTFSLSSGSSSGGDVSEGGGNDAGSQDDTDQGSGDGDTGGGETGGGDPVDPDPGGGEDPGPPDPFFSSIDSLSQGATSLQCSNPSKPRKGTCSKLYSFNAGVLAQNGPGSVSYSWQSSVAAGSGDGAFSVGLGDSVTSLNKEVAIACTNKSGFTIQFALLVPSLESSNTVAVNHNCDEL